MFKIICDYCGEEFNFSEIQEKPIKCSNCNSSLELIEIEEINSDKNTENQSQNDIPIAIKFIYQNTGDETIIDLKDRIVIGRDSFGEKILGDNYLYVSGVHCSIKSVDNNIVVNDEESRNGTFLGINKTDCKQSHNQILKSNDLLILGKEPFLIEFIYNTKQVETKKTIKNKEEKNIEVQEQAEVLDYICKSCFVKFNEKPIEDTCPKCGSYNKWSDSKV